MAGPLACPPHLYLQYIGAVAGVFVGVRGNRGRGKRVRVRGWGQEGVGVVRLGWQPHPPQLHTPMNPPLKTKSSGPRPLRGEMLLRTRYRFLVSPKSGIQAGKLGQGEKLYELVTTGQTIGKRLPWRTTMVA